MSEKEFMELLGIDDDEGRFLASQRDAEAGVGMDSDVGIDLYFERGEAGGFGIGACGREV